jgi:uncharacterized membrane protein
VETLIWHVGMNRLVWKEQFDLLVVAFLSIATLPLVVLTTGPVRVVTALLVVVLCPGYSMTVALYPTNKLGGVERVCLTIVLSLAVVSLSGLALNYSPWGIRVIPAAVTVLTVTLSATLAALYMRSRLSREDRFSLKFDFHYDRWKLLPRFDKWLYGGLAAVVLASVVVGALVIARPKPQQPFTDFYMLGPEGRLQGYPSKIINGEQARVNLVVANREGQDQTYTVDVRWNGETVQTLGPMEVLAGDEWSTPVTLKPSTVGNDQSVEFALKKKGADDTYLLLRLWIDVLK